MRKVFKIGLVFLSVFFMEFSYVSWAKAWDYRYVLCGVMREDDEHVVEEYEVVPIVLGVGKDVTKHVDKFLPWNLWGEIDLVMEGFAGPVISPDNNLEFGCGVGLLWTPIMYKDVSFYTRVSSGPGYTTQHTSRQGSQWNFFSWAAVGVEWLLSEKIQAMIELRYRHFSNAGIKKPNKGINNCGIFAGIKTDF